MYGDEVAINRGVGDDAGTKKGGPKPSFAVSVQPVLEEVHDHCFELVILA
jgi:hypothetical protein